MQVNGNNDNLRPNNNPALNEAKQVKKEEEATIFDNLAEKGKENIEKKSEMGKALIEKFEDATDKASDKKAKNSLCFVDGIKKVIKAVFGQA